jgi:hypothetical protein
MRVSHGSSLAGDWAPMDMTVMPQKAASSRNLFMSLTSMKS